jgi:hypothetical protein
MVAKQSFIALNLRESFRLRNKSNTNIDCDNLDIASTLAFRGFANSRGRSMNKCNSLGPINGQEKQNCSTRTGL